MTGFVIAALFFAFMALIVWCVVKAAEGSILSGAIGIIITIIFLGILINLSIEEDKKGPCHQYETRMMYNSATKSMAPSRVCILRGEWVKETNQ